LLDFPRMGGIKERVKSVNGALETWLARDYAKNWCRISDGEVTQFADFIVDNYMHPREYWDTEQGADDLKGLASERLESDRRTYIPWLNSLTPLAGASVLEIGFGTGSSTVALAEQGAHVTGIDIEPSTLLVAQERCRLYGVHADLQISDSLNFDSRFDFVVFFASLEHMLPAERLTNLVTAADLVQPGGWLVVIEAPNRLWHYDSHTSWLPFFEWLPDELALQYLQYSPREVLQKLSTNPDGLTEMRRWGRGVSFHEIDIALGPQARNTVGPSMDQYLRSRSPLRWLNWKLGREARHQRFLAKQADVPACWFEPYLNVAMRR
jgi:2-polyprenyl-3-methyl-5-hydroxy-6-metoxy-1,4-benzoquinol methylase